MLKKYKCERSLISRKEHAVKRTRHESKQAFNTLHKCAVNNNRYDFEYYNFCILSCTWKYGNILHFSREENTLGHFRLYCSA